ncbi:lipocalin family protein [Amantichitinum ursilacus]|uniref:Outer membrane lipoprotein Blc n=1 Tax=Amantichitinum ursilacus TaxID=857265 RepID=A0A0N0XFI8_9NEIS|nr:lipocalin family protein [Amantichitinum ursilacus]KPC49102.1 Outer membrane lipoprotein Blc precursor [Amantichitinum ursilacus]
MRKLIALLLATFATQVTPAWAEDVHSVPQVDIKRYLGKWYEIAHYPMYWQRKCVADTTATYGVGEDGKITVDNKCRKEDGNFDESKGTAVSVPNSGNAQLKVTFFWPFSGDYWVIGLEPEYRWAVVGTPNHEYLWILARAPKLSAEELKAAQDAAVAQGFALDKLVYTPQSAPQ